MLAGVRFRSHCRSFREFAVRSPSRRCMKAFPRGWRLSRCERSWLLAGALGLVIFGAVLEKRTALRHQPMTDLGAFSCQAWAAWHGGDIYGMTDWHGWHCQYPPAFA